MASGDEPELMLLTAAERRNAIAGGAFVLACISFFIGFAVVTLLFSANGGWRGIVADIYILKILRFTLWQALLSTVLSIALALPVARALARQPGLAGRRWILRLMAIPMGLPALIGAMGLIGIWGRQGSINALLAHVGLAEPISIYGLTGILLAHVFFNLPLAARLMLAGLERAPGEYWLTASALGMPPASIFRLIEWPLLRGILPGIAGLIFMLCATSFTLVLLLGGGPAATTIEVAIYQALRFDFDPARAVALCLLQVAMTAVVLAAMRIFAKPPQEGVTTGRATRRLDGRTRGRRIADLLVIAIAVLFVGAPMVSIIASGLAADLTRLLGEPLFWRSLLTSLSMSAAAGLLAIFVATVFIRARGAIALQADRSLPLQALHASLGAASFFVLLMPPLVLATGWFMALRSEGVDVVLAAPVLVIAINMLMSLPFVMQVLEPAYATHAARTLRLSASLGIVGFARLRRIDWPILRKPLATALSFAMALSLGDLGAVALFGSDGFVTLPWLIYSQLGNYRSNDAQGYALFLAFLCLVLTIVGTAGRPATEGQRDG